MGAVLKNSTPQLIPSAEPTALSALFKDSAIPIRVVDFREACERSQFVTLVVLLPAHPEEAGRGHSTIAEQGIVGENHEKSKLLEVFSKRMAQPRTRYVESDLAFGDVKVCFSSMEV